MQIGQISSFGMRDAIRTSRRLASRLQLPDPWDVEHLCEQIANQRKRPIRVVDRPAQGDSITATVMATASADYIFCRNDLLGIHRDHAICHELGHLLAGHTDPRRLGASSSATTGLPGLVTLRRNCSYGAPGELEAEAIADTIMERVSRRLGNHGPDVRKQRIVHGFSDALR